MRRPTSKYKAKPTVVDGIRFHSQKEARRYQELKLLEKAGEIHRLELQRKLPLLAPAKDAPVGFPLQKVGDYVADFVYCQCTAKTCDESRGVVEDVKGYRTDMYRWKKRHAEIQYGIQIREV